ncbi:hypothetical protein LV779_39285 [Streptomyces thinghirensis]|nr:hypothetical protein [Streptomyces thinghirensis]
MQTAWQTPLSSRRRHPRHHPARLLNIVVRAEVAPSPRPPTRTSSGCALGPRPAAAPA